MDSSPVVEISCWICDARFLLDANIAVRMAEAHAFAAAHSTHWEGIGVKIDIYPAEASHSG